MVQSVLVILFVILIERIFPARTALADVRADKPTLTEVYQRYGLIKFPRTLLATISALLGVIRFGLSIHNGALEIAIMGSAICFVLSAMYDTHIAFKFK